jgi:hypothetical protein
MKNSIKIIGMVRLVHRDKNGKIKSDTGFIKNVITNDGKAAVAGLVGNTGSITAFTYLAVGSGTTAEAATQTALVTEISASGLGRAAATVSRSTTTTTNDTLQFDKTWTASGAVTVEEIGIFNAASVGTMLGRKLTTSKVLANGETLAATYKVIFA